MYKWAVSLGITVGVVILLVLSFRIGLVVGEQLNYVPVERTQYTTPESIMRAFEDGSYIRANGKHGCFKGAQCDYDACRDRVLGNKAGAVRLEDCND